MKKTEKIWKRDWTLDQINKWSDNTLMQTLKIEFVDVGPDFLQATMPVNSRVHNPMGILHGGASVALAETLGSVASWMLLNDDSKHPVGLEINANHIRSITDGFLNGTAVPIHIGKTTHLWEIQMTNDNGDLVCISRFTVYIRDSKKTN